MVDKPLFSILIANYNNGNFFSACFESIQNQIYQNYEVIIVDDKSTDNSIEIIQSLVKDDSRFKIYENEVNKGVGFTKRRCIELANGDICGFLDPDDAIVDSAIMLMVDEHIKYDNCSMIYSNYVFHDKKMNFIEVRKNQEVENGNLYFFNLEFRINHFATFKIKYYNLTEGMNPYMRRAVDMDLYFKLYEVGNFKYIDENLYLYRIHDGGLSTLDNTDKAYYWHWFAINSAAQRRGIVIEDKFWNHFVRKKRYDKLRYTVDLLQKSRFIKLGNLFGFLKWIKNV